MFPPELFATPLFSYYMKISFAWKMKVLVFFIVFICLLQIVLMRNYMRSGCLCALFQISVLFLLMGCFSS